jgi:hypothetical protein
MAFISYGVRVGVRVNDPAALPRVLERLPPGWKPARSPVVSRLYSLIVGGAGTRSGVRRFNLLYMDAVRLARTPELDPVLETFESDLQLYVADTAPRRLFVHAGAVGWRGKAIVIPGRSFTGKTTLVAALVKAGATYYSDEYAVLDTRGRVHPYARLLSVRERGAFEKAKRYAVETLGGRPGVTPLPVGLVLVSEYKPNARWRPRQLSPGKGALALLAHTVPARRRPERALRTIQQVVSRAPVLKGLRGEAEAVVAALVKSLDGSDGLHRGGGFGLTSKTLRSRVPSHGRRP